MRSLLIVLIFINLAVGALLMLLYGWAREIAHVLNGGCIQ